MELPTPKILIVDDKPSNLTALQTILAPLGAEVLSAVSGNDALALMLEHELALIILDVDMPGMDGYEVAEMAKGATQTQDVPIIFLTAAFKDADHQSMAYQAGAVDYLEKPFSNEILISKVQIFLKLYQAHRRTALAMAELQAEVNRRHKAEDAKAVVEAENRAKQIFLANMSHQFRTPLNSILGMTEILSGTPLTREQHDHMETIKNAGENLLTMVSNLLDTTQIETGQLNLDNKPFYLGNLIRNVSHLVRPLSYRKKLLFIAYIDEEVPLWLLGDVHRIRQVLINLLGNAIKFTHWGTVALLVSRDRNDQIVLSVIDTGEGIDQAQQELIFNAFTRCDSCDNPVEGTGLGLSICQRLVSMMGGRIELTSAQDRGSCFRVTLPLKPHAGPDYAPAYAFMQGLKVTIKYDHLIHGLQYQEHFTLLGAQTTLCCEETQLAACFSQEDDRPDLLVIHVERAHRHATISTLEYLQSGCSLDHTPILMCGCGLDPETIQRMEHFHVQFLPYPYTDAELIRKLKLLLGSRAELSYHTLQEVKAPPPMFLVVDDSEDNRVLVSAYLHDGDHQILCAQDGREALELFIQHSDRIQLILMDIQMPGMDGLRCTQEIRAWERANQRLRTPIVVLTAHATKAYEEQSYTVGCDDFLTKPLRKKRLIHSISQFLPAMV
uniref:histidine kinase n=1 Tax=Magnetococcus massalia (strain MO-1) TaxID=451514 RepID=A0A1S7LK26_MAGMO|nr:putative response regulator modulated histidine kinase [Candidatus Magnetococcus massalia]